MALTIRGVRVRAVEIVPERPVETAAGSLATVPLVLVDLETRDGIVGRSYVRCYTPLALPAAARLIEDIAARITGSVIEPDPLNDGLRGHRRPPRGRRPRRQRAVSRA